MRTGTGLVDLIVLGAAPEEAANLTERRPDGAIMSPFSGGKGILISMLVGELRPTSSFSVESVEEALRKMLGLVDWFARVKTD